MISPSGPRLAGAARHVAAFAVDVGARRLRRAGEHLGQSSSTRPRSRAATNPTAPTGGCWRIMHLADTRDQAIDDCTYGLQDFANYFGAAGFRAAVQFRRGHSVAARVRRGVRRQGQLLHRHPWRRDRLHPGPARAVRRVRHPAAARPRLGRHPQATYHSYELFAREVMPHFKGQLTAPRASHDWAKGMRDQLLGRAGQAIVKAINEHTDELKLRRGAADARLGASRWPHGAARRRARAGPGSGPGARRREGMRDLRLGPAFRQARRQCSS